MTDYPRATELTQSGPLQQRSLSLPFSRIVLNPQNFVSDATEVEQNCDATLPLGLGYYAFDKAITLPRAISIWSGTPSPAPAPSFVLVDPTSWVVDSDARVEADGAGFACAAEGAYVGKVVTGVELLESAPVLRISVRDVVGQWSLHLSNGDDESVQLQAGSAICGLHFIDLRDFALASLTGRRQLTLGIIGDDARVNIDEMLFVPPIELEGRGMNEFDTDWAPAGLGLTADHDGVGVTGGETFVTLDSVVRELRFERPTPERGLTVVGRHLAAPVFDRERRVVLMSSEGMNFAVSLPQATGIRYYTHESEIVAGSDGSATPVADVGVWAADLEPDATTYRVGWGLDPTDGERAMALAVEASGRSLEESRREWADYWNSLLARIPHPERFDVLAVDPAGLGHDDVRSSYYYAFIGLYSNVLPPQPEAGYLFPTVATGKGSMWNHGSLGARSAAAWETFLALQYLAYADSDLGWSAFEGLMSRVDEEGSLGGESLPSRKAQTAAVLFALTGDRDALAASYPGLRRLMAWQAARPRWIYGTYDFPGEQDAEFVTSLIIDLGFAAQLANVLGLPADATLFDGLRDDLLHEFREHCFIGSGRDAVQHWFPDDETAALRGGTRGYGLQVTSGLAVPGILDWQRESLLRRFDEQFDATDQLAGFDFVKHPNVGHTAYGLIDNGRPAEALALVNAVMRDVIRSGSFAEVYDRGPERPRPWGVRPSIFGMTQVIDAVWLNNGLRADLGAPQPAILPGAAGAVRNVHVRSQVVSLAVGGE